MMAAAFERLVEGDSSAPPAPRSTFLWITDQPQLNEQTWRRIGSYSTTFGPQQLHIIDSAFDSRVLQSGHLYFLNTQKLGRDKTLVSPSDARTYTFWDTLRATLDDRAQHLLVIIDEAHRGMDLTERQRGEARSIVQKFIVGSPHETVPVPLLVGISATPQRFTALLDRTNRVVRPLCVPSEDVRASGLIKDVVRYYVPAVTEPSDISLLREASRCLVAYSRAWHDYCGSTNESPVAPLLLLQIEDAADGRISRTDIGEALAAISEELGTLPDRAFAHAFQEQASLTLGGRQVRYLAPSHIESDPDVRIVLFKVSLNTGWDCPRAEVMMSFRRATDSTAIAQLVGRMVRTPLARRIANRELLNRVSLFLPHYNKNSVDDVVQRLTSDDDGAPLTCLEDASDYVELTCGTHRELLDLVRTLPSSQFPQGPLFTMFIASCASLAFSRTGSCARALGRSGARALGRSGHGKKRTRRRVAPRTRYPPPLSDIAPLHPQRSNPEGAGIELLLGRQPRGRRRDRRERREPSRSCRRHRPPRPRRHTPRIL